jgi:hypothetical protein
MRYLILLLFFYVFSACSKSENFSFPYKNTNPILSTEIPSAPFINYIKTNKIKSIDMIFNGKEIRNFMVFNSAGLLISRNYYDHFKSEYVYDKNRLVEIKRPGRIFNMDNPDKILFKYKNDKVIEGEAFHYKDAVGKVRFSYYKDSTVIESFYGSSSIEPIGKYILVYSKGKLIHEEQIEFSTNKCKIDYSYKGDTLTCQTWTFENGFNQIDSINKHGLVSKSSYKTPYRFDKAIYSYSSDSIEYFSYSGNINDGYLKLKFNKK